MSSTVSSPVEFIADLLTALDLGGSGVVVIISDSGVSRPLPDEIFAANVTESITWTIAALRLFLGVTERCLFYLF